MTYDETILAKSFSRREQKKLGYGALVGCFFISLCFWVVFNPFSPHTLATLNFQLTMEGSLKMLMTSEQTGESLQLYNSEIKETKPICDISKPRSDICEMSGDIRIHGHSSTIFVATDSSHTTNMSWIIKPYARKGDEGAMSRVKNFTVATFQEGRDFSQVMPKCTQIHNIPAIVFSVGGYTGNNFHAISDVALPLYQTSIGYNGEVRFLLSDKRYSTWTTRFRLVLENLSRYEVIDIDEEDGVHCFPSMILGLKKEVEELHVNPTLSPHTMKDFQQFIKYSYSLERESITGHHGVGSSKRLPRLLIVSRSHTRAFLNEGKMVNVARALGFDVVVMEMDGNLTRVSRVVNSCDVMMGVHGAGLTNMIYLPENAVLIQVIPLGGLEWLSRVDYEEPAKRMKLQYIEYKISQGESSLIEQYPLDHQVFKDPFAITKKGWDTFRSVYMDNQNVKLDLVRLRATLLEARHLLSM